MVQRVTHVTKIRKSATKEPRLQDVARPAQIPRRPRRDPVDSLWSLFCSVRFAVVLNITLALAAMIGTVVPQMPAGIEGFDTELKQFLDSAQTRYGDFSGVLYWAGFYNLYNSLWFRMIVVVVIFSIIMCTLNRWQPIMRLIKHPAVKADDSFLSGLTERAQFKAVPVSIDSAESALRRALGKGRFRVLSEHHASGGDHVLYLYADRDRWTKLVTFVSHAALVMLILTAAGLAGVGWRERSVYFYPGQPVSVGHGTDFQVRSDRFWIDYYADGKSVQEYKDTLAVIEGGKDVLTKTIIVNDPLRYKGVNYFLVSYQPVLFATASSGGQKLFLRKMGATGPITSTTSTGEALVNFGLTSDDNQPMDYLQLPVKDHFLTLE
ncbi:MAG: cytochrome c biogenesis protein ResB, partial [Chloroflexota bacterium]|nr:cytochrome c biogenesis protein ResB [Chloroflexota bacterium]